MEWLWVLFFFYTKNLPLGIQCFTGEVFRLDKLLYLKQGIRYHCLFLFSSIFSVVRWWTSVPRTNTEQNRNLAVNIYPIFMIFEHEWTHVKIIFLNTINQCDIELNVLAHIFKTEISLELLTFYNCCRNLKSTEHFLKDVQN